jgi:hypothetical protein
MSCIYEEDFTFHLPYRITCTLPNYGRINNSENLKWCIENLQDITVWHWSGYTTNGTGIGLSIWEFKNKDDALMFKLSCGGNL